MYDVMIIGGGPGGYTAAGKAAKNGLKTVLFEKDKLGGTCLNRGCIPTKALIRSAEVYDLLRHGENYGVEASDVSFSFTKIAARRDEIVETLRSGIEKGLKAAKAEVVYGEAKILEEGKISCNGEIYEGKEIIVASGSAVGRPPIEGLEYALTSDDLLIEKERFPKSMVIIGGGVIGAEIADAYAALGSEITILEMADRILPTMEKEIAQRLAMFLKKRGVRICTGIKVEKIEKTEEGKRVFYTGKESTCVDAEEVLLAAGRRPNIRGLGISEEGLENPHIHIIGDAKKGNIQLAHKAIADAEDLIDILLGKEPSTDLSLVPSCIYTHTEIASVGMTEDEAKKNGSVTVKKVLTGANGKAVIEGSENGFVKIVLKDDVIVGASIIAPHATELISEFTLAIQKKMTVKDMKEIIHPHPTVSEMLGEVLK